MIQITSKQLREQIAAMLNRVKRGKRMKLIHDGRAVALLIPPNGKIDPTWDEIMTEVRKARAKSARTRPNPVLAERKKRRNTARPR